MPDTILHRYHTAQSGSVLLNFIQAERVSILATALCLWIEILGSHFIVSHERPFDTEKNASYRFSISLLVPELQRFEYTKSEGHWKRSGNKNLWRHRIRKPVLWKFKWSISHLMQVRCDWNFAYGWSNIKVIWSWQNFCCLGNNVVSRPL